MKSWTRHPLRVTGRLLWLIGELLLTAISYVRCSAFQSHDSLPQARAKRLQRSSRRVMRIFQVETQSVGSVPLKGLLVCNHLSYLDVLVLAALTPTLFVAKSEVRRWPVFGWFARLAGTIFVNRNKPSQTGQSADRIAVALGNGALVVLFPEGTSSGGETVLPLTERCRQPGLLAFRVRRYLIRKQMSLPIGFASDLPAQRKTQRRWVVSGGPVHRGKRSSGCPNAFHGQTAQTQIRMRSIKVLQTELQGRIPVRIGRSFDHSFSGALS